MEERLAQLQAKFEADRSFAEGLFSLETPEEVQSLLKAEGMEFSLEEINTLKSSIIKALEKGETDELSDEDLEEVAGGFIFCLSVALAAIFTGVGAAEAMTRGRW